MMSEEGWLDLESKWTRVLSEFCITAYRSSDCNASQGEFVGWDGRAKDALRSKLVEVINQSWRGKNRVICPVFTWVIMDITAFNANPEIDNTFYEELILVLIAGNKNAIVNHQDGKNTVRIFFEDGRDVRPHIRQKLIETKQSEPRIIDISFVSKRDHVPLQVADIVAYEAVKSEHEGLRRFLVDIIKGGTGYGIRLDKDFKVSSYGDFSESPS